MKTLKLALCGLLAVAALGCKDVDIENGTIPAEYVELAKKLAGEYKGRFENNHGSLNLSIDNNNKMIATFSGSRGDLIGAGCNSKIGNLRKVYLAGKGKKVRVTGALFDFSAGKCSDAVEGRVVEMALRTKNSKNILDLTIFERRDFEYVCPPGPGNPGGPGYGNDNCQWQSRDYYLTGRFVKPAKY